MEVDSFKVWRYADDLEVTNIVRHPEEDKIHGYLSPTVISVTLPTR
jgi:hypothetical protein